MTIVGTFPADSHPPIIYPAALTAQRDSRRGRGLPGLPLLGRRPRAIGRRLSGFAVLD